MAPLDLRYSQAGFNVIPVQVCANYKTFWLILKVYVPDFGVDRCVDYVGWHAVAEYQEEGSHPPVLGQKELKGGRNAHQVLPGNGDGGQEGGRQHRHGDDAGREPGMVTITFESESPSFRGKLESRPFPCQ